MDAVDVELILCCTKETLLKLEAVVRMGGSKKHQAIREAGVNGTGVFRAGEITIDPEELARSPYSRELYVFLPAFLEGAQLFLPNGVVPDENAVTWAARARVVKSQVLTNGR